MKRVLLTGANGFIGRHCGGRLLERGYEVHAVSSGNAAARTAGMRWHRADLLRAGRAQALLDEIEPTHLLHLAWYTEHGRFYSSPENFRWVEASLRLLRGFAGGAGRRAVVAGTCAEYDWSQGVCNERSTRRRPGTVYGVCKNALGEMFEALAGSMGISGAWGRIFLLYGPGQPPGTLVSSVIRALLRGEPARCSHGEQVRDFLYVEDVAEALVALLDSEVEGPVNIGSGQPLAVKDLVGAIARRLGREELVELGAVPAPEGDPPLLVADVERLSREVGFTPRHDLDAGLARTIEHWRQQAGSPAEREAAP